MIQSYGKLTPTPGTPLRATQNVSAADKTLRVHGVLIQALWSNTGRVYIGKQTLSRTNATDLFAVLPAPGAGALPAFSAAITTQPAGVNVNDIWVDVDTANDGVLVTVLVS